MPKLQAKMINADYDVVAFSSAWATAWRGFVDFGADRLQFSGHEIPYTEIEQAVLVDFPGVVMRRGCVLAFRHNGVPYQFGLNASPFGDALPPFPLEHRAQDPQSRRVVGGLRALAVGLPVFGILTFAVIAALVFLLAFSFGK